MSLKQKKNRGDKSERLIIKLKKKEKKEKKNNNLFHRLIAQQNGI